VTLEVGCFEAGQGESAGTLSSQYKRRYWKLSIFRILTPNLAPEV
jgi:hypothetical protein